MNENIYNISVKTIQIKLFSKLVTFKKNYHNIVICNIKLESKLTYAVKNIGYRRHKPLFVVGSCGAPLP
jgi:hypothetical protein